MSLLTRASSRFPAFASLSAAAMVGTVFAAILFGFSVQHMALFAAAALLASVLFARPQRMVYWAIAVSPVMRFPGFFQYVDQLKAIFLLGILAGWALLRLRDSVLGVEPGHLPERPDAELRRLDLLFLLFATWAVFCWTFRVEEDVLREHTALQIAFPLVSHLFVIGFFFIFRDLFRRDEAAIRRASILIVFCGLVVACIAITQFLIIQYDLLPFLKRILIPEIDRQQVGFGERNRFFFGSYRSTGIFNHPNAVGIYLALICPITLACYHAYRRLGGVRIFFLAAGGVIALGIVCCGARGAFLNVAVSLGILTVVYGTKGILMTSIQAIAGVLGGGILWASLQTGDYLRIENLLSGRQVIWKSAWTLFLESPIWGWGPGSFQELFFRYFGFASERDWQIAQASLKAAGQPDFMIGFGAHNLFLNYGVEMGLVGVALIFLFYAIYFSRMLRYLRAHAVIADSYFHLIVGCFAAVSGNLAHSFFESTTNFNFYPIGITFAALIAISMALTGRTVSQSVFKTLLR